MCHLPSVIAAATVIHVMDEMELCNPLQCEMELLDRLNLAKVSLSSFFLDGPPIDHDRSFGGPSKESIVYNHSIS